jgi:lipopolysaccharide export system permease protein
VRGRGYALALTGYVAYYVLYRALENWGSQGRLPLWLAGELPNFLFASVGLLWLLRLTRPGAGR